MMTAAQRLINKGRQEREEELLAEWRELTQSLLEERFGSLPAPVTARIAAAGADDLKRWTARIHRSDTLDEVLAHTP